jgi:hypothetical protein
MTRNLTRRGALGTIGLGLASPLVLSAQSPGPNQTPSIQLNYGINLDRKEIYDFVLDPTRIDFPPDLPAEQGYSVVQPAKPAGTHNLPLFAAKREYYVVRQRNNLVGNFSVVVFVEQPITATVSSYLLVRDTNVSQAQKDKIVAVFSQYDPTAEPDPIKYAIANMGGTDIKSEMFLVRTSYSLHKSGNAIPHTEQRDKMIALYKGTGGGTFYLGQNENLSDFLQKAGIGVVKVGEETIGPLPPPSQDKVHERPVKNVNDTHEANAALDDIAKQATPTVEGCHFGPRETRKIAAIFAWPEFKIDWVDVHVQIGCVSVIFSLPVLRTRLSTLVLYAYVVHVDNLGQLVLDMITGCIVKAAIIGAVLGVVFADFAAALAAFEAVFEDCIDFSLGQAAVCLAPGLALLVESTSWS